MIAVAKPNERVAAFPESEVVAALTKWWAEESLERSDDPFGPGTGSSGTLYDLLPALDSLTIVRSFLVIERVLGLKIPVTLVKAGGYDSREEMLKHLVPKLRKHCEKSQSQRN